jgi:hypothetical protein
MVSVLELRCFFFEITVLNELLIEPDGLIREKQLGSLEPCSACPAAPFSLSLSLSMCSSNQPNHIDRRTGTF